MDKSILEEIGLTKSEINVYLALLELGSTTTGHIVDKSKASSSKIYEILDRLIQKGLVSYVIKAGVKYFEAAPPERIMDYMKEKEENLRKQTEALKKIVPELELKRKLSKYKSEATIYKGMKGVETAFMDSLKLLKPGDQFLVMGIPQRGEALNRFFVKFEKERCRLKIKERRIVNEAARYDLQNRPEGLQPGVQIKFTPEITPSAVNIFNDRVIIFPESKDIILIVIDNKEIAESFRVQFEMWWQQDTSVIKGFDAFRKEVISQMDEFGPGDSYDVLGAAFGMKGYEKKYADFFRGIHKERVNKGIKGRLLFQYGAWETIDKYRKELYKENCEVKFLPYKTKFPVAIFPSEKKTLLVIQKEEPTVIVINNEEVSQAFRKHFESRWGEKVQTYEGNEGFKIAFGDILSSLNKGDKLSIMGIFDFDPEFRKMIVDFHNQRSEKGIDAEILLNYGAKGIGNELGKFPGTKIKYLQKGMVTPSVFLIYGDKVLISLPNQRTFFRIENKEAADSFKAYFDNLWSQDVKVYRGFEGVKSFFDNILDEKELWFIGGNYGIKEFPEYWDWYQKERIKRKQFWHDLVDAGSSDDLSGQPYYEHKLLPPELKSPHVICITNKIVANILWAGDKTVIFVAENKELVESYKKYFDLLWKQAK